MSHWLLVRVFVNILVANGIYGGVFLRVFPKTSFFYEGKRCVIDDHTKIQILIHQASLKLHIKMLVSVY